MNIAIGIAQQDNPVTQRILIGFSACDTHEKVS